MNENTMAGTEGHDTQPFVLESRGVAEHLSDAIEIISECAATGDPMAMLIVKALPTKLVALDFNTLVKLGYMPTPGIVTIDGTSKATSLGAALDADHNVDPPVFTAFSILADTNAQCAVLLNIHFMKLIDHLE